MKRELLLLFFCFISSALFSQNYTISGFVTEEKSGERLLNANVFDQASLKGVTANTYGFYSITLPKGEVKISASYIGYETQSRRFNLKADTTINFSLSVNSEDLETVTVYGNASRNKVESTEISVNELTGAKIDKIPVIMGEADVLKVMQLLPGVQGGVEGTSGIYVRGGGPDQNLFLLDGVPVYNASHLMGFFSVFNPDAIKTVKLYKGGFPARFGGRLSSVVDISMKDGNMKELHGDFSIGLITSKLMLEGPLVKDKTSFMLSARRTYFDVFLKPLIAYQNMKWDDDVNAGAFINDYNLKLNHIFSDRSRLYLSGYLGQDHVHESDTYTYDLEFEGKLYPEYNADEFGISWGNQIASARWNYLISPKLFSNTTATYSKYKFNTYFESYEKSTYDSTESNNIFDYFSGIQDFTFKVDFDYYPNNNHAIKFGTSYINHNFTPGAISLDSDYDDDEIQHIIDSLNTTQNVYANDFAAYIEDDIKITERLKMNAGLHFSLFNVEGENYFNIEPRVSMRYKARDNFSLKASYSRMVQHVHLLNYSGISLPTDLWVPVTKKFEPPISDQVAAGIAWNLPNNFTFTSEGFYKTMHNLIEYRDGESFAGIGSSWESKVEKGEGWSYGAEFMLEKTAGKTTGWIGYTLAWNWRQFDGLNFGNKFSAKYDRRHDISVVLTHEFSEKFDIGLIWVYGTGNAVTLASTEYQVAQLQDGEQYYYYPTDIKLYKGRNNYRMPNYHRMDLGLNWHKPKKHGVRTWSLSVYNAYNHQNPFFLMWETDRTQVQKIEEDGQINYYTTSVKKLKQVSIFPIVPTFTYSYKF